MACASAGFARANEPRIATIDWAVLETLLAIGIVPVAAAELILFRRVSVEPMVPERVADIGLRGSPNYEALMLASPDLIFSSNYYTWAEPKLRLVAPVESVSVYDLDISPFEAAERAALTIGAGTGRRSAGQALVDETHAHIARLRDRLAGYSGEPVIPINLGDPRHFRVFGADSMFGGVIERLGLTNAWRQRTRYSATAPVGLEALAGIENAWIVVIPPIPPDARRILSESAFWTALPSVRDGRVLTLAPINPFGALPAALRFAELLANALTDLGRERGLG
ncbi:iron-siderophore ABC transporter substrate-binding protein [Amorphus sp. 3PC139-8]|uniref:iron-siderophore ABC transporter substrate-binding protein n=1 Tax=Amorphus sp. 3PC139-8 TaxID=2735676 RepID=UPI00345C8E3E